jgi:shikimate dehydrogenase
MKLFGLIGFPLHTSFSQQFFTEKFLRLNLPYSYKNFPLQRIEDIETLFQQYPQLHGLNITTPYKEKIIPFLTDMSNEVQQIGAVNCIQIHEKKMIGYNTDVFGFSESLMPLIDNHPINNALILGTGGAAKAIAFSLSKLGISYVMVSRRKHGQAIDYRSISKNLLDESQCIINCTPLGMSPLEQECPPLPYQWIGKQHLAYDLIYTPEETVFLRKCKEQGSVVKNGLQMLHLQAEKSWAIWNNNDL